MDLRFPRRVLALAAIGLTLTASARAAEAPTVKLASPEHGDKDVDPGITEIRIEFDREMTTGAAYSVVGGGESFPKTTGNPRWESRTVIVLPVKLEPNHDYWLSINSDRFADFVSAAGVPAVPYPIAFTTGKPRPGAKPSSPAPPTPSLSPRELNEQSTRELMESVLKRYSHRDLRKVDWEREFRKHENAMSSAKDAKAFVAAAAEFLAPARDAHIWIVNGEETTGTFQRDVRRNFDFKQLPDLVPKWTKLNRNVYAGEFPGDISYLLIGSWENQYAAEIDEVVKFIGGLDEDDSLIIDLRGNSGGAEALAQKVAGCFIDQPAVYAAHVYRDPEQQDGFGPRLERTLQAHPDRPPFRGKIAVLMGLANMSSSEGFLLMMKQVPSATLIGERSYGSSGHPKPHRLANGVEVFLPSWKAMTPDGDFFEGKGIAPDLEVEFKPGRRGDPVLERALRELRKN